MSGVRTVCRDNGGLGRVGCGAVYGGGQIHCTICHETFSSASALDLHLGVDRHGDLWHHEPWTVKQLRQDERGIWRANRPDLPPLRAKLAGGGASARHTAPPGPEGGR